MPASIAKGKTKEIFDATENAPHGGCATCSKVLIVSNDMVTAGDGEHRVSVPDKGAAATATTLNVFKLLKRHGLPTHFLKAHPKQRTAFYALKAEMIPLEVVTRRIATGSYLKRNPGVVEGEVFPMLEFELFHKDDAKHDPLVIWNSDGWRMNRYKADHLVSEQSKIDTIDFEPDWMLFEFKLDELKIIALQVFLILEEAWKELGVVLYDMKIEFGLVDDGKGGKRLVVADVITNDEWRIKDEGGRQLSKQVFRDIVKAGEVTPVHVEELRRLYNEVAELTAEFPNIGCAVTV